MFTVNFYRILVVNALTLASLFAQQAVESKKIAAAEAGNSQEVTLKLTNRGERPIFARITFNALTAEQAALPGAGTFWQHGKRTSGKPTYLKKGESFSSPALFFSQNLPVRITYSFAAEDSKGTPSPQKEEYAIEIVKAIPKINSKEQNKWPFDAKVYKVIDINDLLKNYLPQYSKFIELSLHDDRSYVIESPYLASALHVVGSDGKTLSPELSYRKQNPGLNFTYSF